MTDFSSGAGNQKDLPQTKLGWALFIIATLIAALVWFALAGGFS